MCVARPRMQDSEPMPGSWPGDDDAMNMDGESYACETEAVTRPPMINLAPSKGLPRDFVIDMASRSTPTGRPLVEPPMFNYDDFVRRFVPSDKRFAILFPLRKDVGKMTDYKDRYIEYELLHSYRDWVDWMALVWPYKRHHGKRKPTQKQAEFYKALREDLFEDLGMVLDERNSLLDETNKFGTLPDWEFRFLDDDLGTKHIQKQLAEWCDYIFEEVGAPSEAREKYGHLFSEDADYEFRNRNRISWRNKQEKDGKDALAAMFKVRAKYVIDSLMAQKAVLERNKKESESES